MRFTGKTYIVTGASSGIGQGCCEALLNESAIVYGIDLNEKTIDNPDYTHIKVDITDERSVEFVLKQIGHIDGLVNAAGVWGNSKPFFEMNADEFKRILNINTVGAFIVSKYASIPMIAAGKGKIVNIGCIRSGIQRKNMADYAASKGAITSLTQAMALDMSPYNIQVNAVMPGFTYTGMTKNSFDNEEVRKQSEALIPQGRLAMPSDIAKVVLFLLSEDSDYMTGSSLYADGGFHVEQ